jgi:spoIIIJ-associated protein
MVDGGWWRDIASKPNPYLPILLSTIHYSPFTIQYPLMLDQRLDRGKQWLEQLLNLSGIATTIDTQQPEGASATNYWLTIAQESLTPAQIELLIGSEGATIDAIQYLANASLNLHQEADLQAGYTIELDGYRQRRAIALKAIADDAAASVRTNGTEVVLQPMSSAERRQMHTFFDSDPSYSDLSTYSRGQEPDRRLVVKLAQAPEEA